MFKLVKHALAAAALSLGFIVQPAVADLRIHTYSSPDPDSVNTFAVETEEGLVVISTQRTFSQAQRAIVRIGQPVTAIVIPVPQQTISAALLSSARPSRTQRSTRPKQRSAASAPTAKVTSRAGRPFSVTTFRARNR